MADEEIKEEATSHAANDGGQPPISAEKKWYDKAQELFEDLLKEADEARKEAKEDDEESLPPFLTVWPHPPPPEFAHLAHLLPRNIKLSYQIESDESAWDEKDDEAGDQIWGATVVLDTEGLARDIYSRCGQSLDKFLAANIITDKEGRRRPLSEIIGADGRDEVLENFARDTMEFIIYRLLTKLEVAFNEHWAESHFLGLTRMITETTDAMEEMGVEVIRDPNEVLSQMNRLLAEAAARRRRLLKSDVADCLGVPDFQDFAAYYEKTLPVWRDAKLIYKQNSRRATWRDLIRAAYPDMKLDDDLIERLSGRLNDLPQDVQEKLSEKGGDSKPSSIALEHAARLCGAAPYQYSLRHLYNLKNEAKHRAEMNSEETNDQ
jgi:hypothetical protein